MYLWSVFLVLIILSGSSAALPPVGICTFMEYFCDARNCNTDFIKGLQKDPNGDCSAKFKKMTSCVTKSVQFCAALLSKSEIDRIIRQNYQENIMCYDGGSAIPTMPSVGSPCSSSFSTDADNCLRTFHQKFAANKSDPDLCSESAKAKKCMKNLITSACTFSYAEEELLNLGFSDYNPYCENNRDPGATGNGQCYGVRPLNFTQSIYVPGNSATAGMKSVAHALLVPFLLLLFFVEISSSKAECRAVICVRRSHLSR